MQAMERLSERQAECLRLVGRGYTSKQIAAQLGLSPRTVDNHISVALRTLDSTDRAEAARRLLEHEAARQRLPSASPPVAEAIGEPEDEPSGGSKNRLMSWLRDHPIGGKENTLSALDRMKMMLTIATLLFVVVIGLAIVAKAGLWALSPR